MRIRLLTTLWKRSDLERVTLEWNRKAAEKAGFKVECVAVGSEKQKSRKVAESAGWDYIECKNKPLSKKWQKGVDGCTSHLMLIGSDDIISVEYFREVKKRLKEGYDCITNRSIYFHINDEVHFYDPITSDVGFVVSETYGKSMGWNLYRDERNDYIAKYVMERIAHRAQMWFVVYDCRQMPIVDIKTDINMWPIERLHGNKKPPTHGRFPVENAEVIYRQYFRGLIKRLKR